MMNVTELLSKYLKSLKAHSGPRWTMEALDLLSKCPGSSPLHRYWNPFQKNLFTAHTVRLSMRRERKEDGRWSLLYKLWSNSIEGIFCRLTFLICVSFYFSLCLFIFLCVVLFVFVSFWPLGLCSAAGLLDKSRRSAGNAILIWKIFEGCVCQGWQGAGTLGAMGALEGGHL